MPLSPRDTTQDVLWQGPLTFDSFAPHGGGPGTNVTKDEETAQPYREALRARPPQVCVGRPVVSPLRDVISLAQIDPILRAQVDAQDLYLARFSFGLLPPRGPRLLPAATWWLTHRFTSADFTVELLPDAEGGVPCAYDLHPANVVHQRPHTVRINVAPTLRFQEVEASVGGAEVAFDYPTLMARITAMGAGTSEAIWSYETWDRNGLRGDQWMYLLIGAPKGSPAGSARLALSAMLEIAAPIPGMILKPSWEGRDLISPLW
jgi:hypothetical protein